MSVWELAAYLLPGGIQEPCIGLEQARLAEALGLGAPWLGERFDTKDFPSVLGACSQVARRLGLQPPPLSSDFIAHRQLSQLATVAGAA